MSRKYDRFIDFFLKQERHPALRSGQHLMNVLGDFDIEQYKAITVTKNDCSHQDQRISKTLLHLKEVWKDEN